MVKIEATADVEDLVGEARTELFVGAGVLFRCEYGGGVGILLDRKSTRLNSSHPV